MRLRGVWLYLNIALWLFSTSALAEQVIIWGPEGRQVVDVWNSDDRPVRMPIQDYGPRPGEMQTIRDWSTRETTRIWSSGEGQYNIHRSSPYGGTSRGQVDIYRDNTR